MAGTVIDELVVLLKLDAAQFTTGQRNAVSSLRDMEQQTQGHARNIGSSAGQLRSYFAAIDSPLSALKERFIEIASVSRRAHEETTKQLSTVDTQVRRTGQSVKDGAETGAQGFSGLAVAGLSAFAAIKSVQTAMGAVHDIAQRTAQFGRSAYFSGVSYQWLGAFEQYAQTKGVAPTTTEQVINEFVQKQTAFTETGAYDNIFQNIQRAVPGADPHMPIEKLIPLIAAALAGKDGPAAQFWANQAGLGPITNALVFGQPAFEQGMARYGRLAPTPEEVRAAGEFDAALADLEIHFEKLYRQLLVSIGPPLVTLFHILSFLADKMGQIHGPLNWLFPNMTVPAPPPTVPSASGGPTSVPGGPPAAADTRNWWQRNAPTSLGGLPAPAVSSTPGPSAALPGSAGAYGVPGAVMNYGMHGGGAHGANLVQIPVPGGGSVTLSRDAAPSAALLLKDLSDAGYPLQSVQGFNDRSKLAGGPSEHAFGFAMDINPSPADPYKTTVPLPARIKEMAARRGWIWGGNWQSPHDEPHFQWGGPGTSSDLIPSLTANNAAIRGAQEGLFYSRQGGMTTIAPIEHHTSVGNIHVHQSQRQPSTGGTSRKAIDEVFHSNTGLE